jgi:hypothetical protein
MNTKQITRYYATPCWQAVAHSCGHTKVRATHYLGLEKHKIRHKQSEERSKTYCLIEIHDAPSNKVERLQGSLRDGLICGPNHSNLTRQHNPLNPARTSRVIETDRSNNSDVSRI